MRLAESDEMVQGFVFNRLHKSFDPCIEIRRPDRQHLWLDAFILQKPLELGRELRVPIMDQMRRFLFPVGYVIYKRLGLFRDPSGIGISY